jgi:hypothetical protein
MVLIKQINSSSKARGREGFWPAALLLTHCQAHLKRKTALSSDLKKVRAPAKKKLPAGTQQQQQVRHQHQ